MDWLRKLFNEPGTLAVMIASGVIGFVVGVANGFVQKKHNGWFGFFQAVFTGIAVAVIVGLAIKEYIPSETIRLAVIGSCAVIAEDIVAGLKAIGRLIREDPFGAVFRLIDAFRGRSTPPTGEPPVVAPTKPE